MLKEHLVYEDFDGNKREEDFYFNLTKQEISEMELSKNGGLTKFLEKIAQEQNNEKMVEYFKDFLLKSYGEKSNDGKSFVKTKEVRERFEYSMAFSEIWMRFVQDESGQEFIKFIKGTMPRDMAEEIEKEDNKAKLSVVSTASSSPNNNA